MPIYEYRCKKGHTFDVRQSFSDDPITTCEVCGATVERVYHPVAVHFKGSGFYNTDYGTKKRAREMKDAKDGSSTGSSESSGSSSDSAGSGSTEKSSSTSTAGGDSKPAKSDSTKSGSSSAKSE